MLRLRASVLSELTTQPLVSNPLRVFVSCLALRTRERYSLEDSLISRGIGGPAERQTRQPLVSNPLRVLVSYLALRTREDSNPRPSDPKSDALSS